MLDIIPVVIYFPNDQPFWYIFKVINQHKVTNYKMLKISIRKDWKSKFLKKENIWLKYFTTEERRWNQS